MRKYKRIASIFVAATLTASLFAGCQKSPEKEIVSNKDMDNMIEQAQDTQSSTTEVAEVAKDYDTYQTDIKDDSLHVTVHADAQVDIPDTGQLSIFRVKQMQFDQTFLNQVRTTFFGQQNTHTRRHCSKMPEISLFLCCFAPLLCLFYISRIDFSDHIYPVRLFHNA